MVGPKDCNEGECPSGTELSRFSNGTLSCTSCLPGFGKEAAGNRQCQACEPGMFSNGSGFCQPCEAGMRQASYGQAACEFCQPGHAPRDDAKFCLSCSRGTYAAAGDASCQPCEPGSYQRDTGQTFCEVCPAGFTTDEDRTACNRCQAGTFSKDSLTGCQTCGGFTTPNEQQTNCIPSWAKLAGAVVFTFFAAFFMWLLPFLIGIKRHIADVSWLPTDEAVILTTQQKHQFSSKYIPVVFHDTGVSWLQESTESTTEDGETKSAPTISIMYVKRTSPTQLQIYTEAWLSLGPACGNLHRHLSTDAFGRSVWKRFLGYTCCPMDGSLYCRNDCYGLADSHSLVVLYRNLCF